jgi:hypothetical protein
MTIGKPFKFIQGLINTKEMKFQTVDDEELINKQLIAAVMNYGANPIIATFKLEQRILNEK